MTEYPRQPGQVLRRFLGPAGPDLGCDECFELVDIYVEAELAGEDADFRVPGMRAHLQGCPACAEEHDSLLELMSAQR